MAGKEPSSPLCGAQDHRKVVLLATGWLGVSMLLPMNFYFNADSYWKYKFRNTSLPAGQEDAPLTDLQLFWGNHISLVSMAPNFLFLLLNVVWGHRLAVRPRVLLPLALNTLLFLASSLLTQLDTDSWQTGFYGLTLSAALLFNISDSVYQGAFSSVVGRLPSQYMGAMMAGQAVGGVLSSGTSVLLLATGSDQATTALLYFLVASGYLLLSLLLKKVSLHVFQFF